MLGTVIEPLINILWFRQSDSKEGKKIMSLKISLQQKIASLAIAGIVSCGIVGCAGGNEPAETTTEKKTEETTETEEKTEAGSSTGGGTDVPVESGSATN